MDVGALLFQLQAPHEVGVPILYSTGAGTSEAITRFSFVRGCYSRWPKIKVFGKDCCVAQLVCLLQFGYAPRSPQRSGGKHTKYINHGYRSSSGRFCTRTYNQDKQEAIPDLVRVPLEQTCSATFFAGISHEEEFLAGLLSTFACVMRLFNWA